jgi:hypothetical protein
MEMVRGGLHHLKVEATVFHAAEQALESSLLAALPFVLRHLPAVDEQGDAALRVALDEGGFDYVILFDSSGMYNGEDIAGLAAHLTLGRLDAVWGSRRLSVRDIQESYRLKYRHNALRGAVSYVGSHALSLLYLALYGRYISDTLSAAWAIRTPVVLALPCPITHKLANQHLLSALLRRRAEMLEIPVQFFSISPEQVRRTSALDGLRAMAVALRSRLGRAPREPLRPPSGDTTREAGAWTGF